MELRTVLEEPAVQTQQKTRILYLDHSPLLGGSQLSLLELVQTLNRDLFDVAVACTDRCPQFLSIADEICANINITKFPRLRGNPFFIPIRYIQAMKGILKVCRSFRPHIIHSNTVRTHIYAALAAGYTQAKVVWTLRDFDYPKKLFKLLVNKPNAIICVSDSVYRYYNPDGAYKHMKTVPNGIILPKIDPVKSRCEIRSEFGLPDDSLVVGSVGRIVPWKGQMELIKAAALVVEALSNVRFVVMGSADMPDFRREVELYAEKLGIRDKVIFSEFRMDVLKCMCAFDVLVHTSKEPEPFGRVLIEAMATGVPVIASPLGGPSEILDESCGRLVHPENTSELASAIVEVLTNKPFASRIATRAMEVFKERYDQSAETSSIEAVYKLMMNRE